MIIVRTPFRVSLFGGGTDFPEWYETNGGAVIGMAINKYCYTNVRRLPPFFDHKFRIVYSKIEHVQKVSQIEHPVVRAVLDKLNTNTGLEIHHSADLPARSGLGSSSSFAVGLLHALSSLYTKQVTKRSLLEDAIHVERILLKETVGCQDQAWAAYGGFNRINFEKTGHIQVNPISIAGERIQAITNSMILVFTGVSRISSEIAQEQISQLKENSKARKSIFEVVNEATTLLSSPNFSIKELGDLLHESWHLKRSLAKNVSNRDIDAMYTAAREAGAAGGKVIGSGGGGFMLLIVEPKNRSRVLNSLSKLIHVSLEIDYDGSKVVVHQPAGLDNA